MAPRIRRRITSSRRDEIEKEQDVLSRAIVRPFDVVSNLPVSFNPPPNGQYETIMKTPLTIKDSAVFYRSLMKSRYNYVHMCPMFELYWVKQSSYARKLVEQDRPLPKSMKDDAFGDREPVLGSEFSARDVMVKLCDASISLGPHEFAIRLFIAKDDRSEKTFKSKDAKLLGCGKEKIAIVEKNDPIKAPINNQASTTTTNPPQSQDPAPAASKSAALHTDQSMDTTPANLNKKSEAVQKHNSENPSKPQIDTSIKKPATQMATAPPDPPHKPQDAPAKALPVAQNSAPSPAPPPPADPNNMQSIENTIMISNLNAIARTNDSLNKLMKIVALGSASPQQISTFQGFIRQAREMGPQAHHSYLFNPTSQGEDRTSKLSKEKKALKERKPKEKKEKLPKDQKLTAFQEKYYVGATILFEFVENSNVRFKIPQDSIMELLERTEEQTQHEGTEAESRDILVSFMWIHNRKEMMAYKKKLQEYEEKIAAAQATKGDKDGSVSNAETSQSSNEASEKVSATTRGDETVTTDIEKVPESTKQKGSAIEAKQSQSNSTTTPDPPNSMVSRSQKEASPIIPGTPVELGGSKDSSDKESSVAHVKPEEMIQNPETASDAQPSAAEVEISTGSPQSAPGVSRSTRSRNYSTNTKKASSKSAASKKLERPREPEARFTAVSFTLRGIPHRFVPIILNSAEPHETVRNKMTHLMQKGFRLPHFFLWYQLDGRLDEALGDGIRQELIAEEKKMSGISSVSTEKPTPEQQAEKKRKNKEKADERAKKLKLATANGRVIAAEPMVKSENESAALKAT